MSQAEKNRKLAEFAELPIKHQFEPIGVGDIKACSRCGAICPDKSLCNLPNFFDPELGIAWGFKWLIPKLYLKLCREGKYYKIRAVYLALEDEVKRGSHEPSINPGAALAEAVLKLLEASCLP